MRLMMRMGGLLMLMGVGVWLASPTFQAAEKPNGQALYARRCVMCHGRDGKGFKAMKTQDFTDPKWQASMKDAQIADIIKNGKKEAHMPAFGDKLNDAEIQAIVAHIRTLNSAKK
jgi:cbb3-type cytochrome c oxidase subunit III